MAEDARIGTSVGSYRLLRRVGRGGMSVVYLAVDLRTGNEVALKLLSPELAENQEFRERFARESRIALSVKHPNIVPVYEAGEEGDHLYIAMRYVEGRHLGELIRAEGPLPFDRTLGIVAPVAMALDAAHDAGLVHRDVKPGNILLGARTDDVFLGDFGLTKKALSASGFTATGQMVGTIDYVAPEQIRGDAVDGRADVYSLGCVLFECLSGHVPFPRDREVATLWAHLDEVPPKITDQGVDVPRGLDHVLARAMAKDPADRYPTATALTGDLRSEQHAAGRRPRRRAFRTTRQRRRRRLMATSVVVAIAFAVLATLITVPIVSRDAEAGSEIAPNSIGVLDPETGDVTGTVGLEQRPGSVAASADAVWVTHPDVGTVTRIDPNAQAVVDSIPVGENPAGIAFGFDAVWVVNSGERSVSRISPQTNQVVGEAIDVGNGPTGIAIGEDAVWVTNRFDGTISRIDPDTHEVAEDIPVGSDPRGIAIGAGSVWVALAGSNQVVRIDPTTNDVTQSIGVGNAPDSLAATEDAVWVANTLDDTVMEIDPDTNTGVGLIEVGDGPSSLAVVQGTVWVANEWDGTLSRIEHGQTSPRPIEIGSVPQDLAAVNGDLWVSVRGTATSHRGGTLRLVSVYPPESLDPGASYDAVGWQVLHLIGDGLVAFEPTGGDPVPDLATAIPTPTDGGRTYTFRLRPGIRYSNGGVVAPADFLLAFERGWRLNPGAHQDLYGRLVGAKACRSDPGACDLSEGIVTDDASGTITFHLKKPDPEFIYKLTIPFAYAVPPYVLSVRAAAGVPGTGPYMLEEPMTDDGLTLVRNPDFHPWSPAARPDGYVDRIEWSFGVKPQEQIEAVAGGEADLAFNANASKRLEDLLVRSPAQVHTSPAAGTYFAVLDTRVPPFDDVDVRQAMNLAIDRDRIVEIMGGAAAGQATCQQLPPNFPGYEPYCPYTLDPGPGGEGSWTEPDMEEAQRLVRRSGTAGTRILVKLHPTLWSEAQVALLSDYIIELLDELGYVGSVEEAGTFDEFYSQDLEFQMAFDAWFSDYPAASNFITNRFKCDTSYTPSAGFCDRRIDVQIDRATRMQIDDPAAARPLWVEVDRKIADQAPYVWLMNPIAVEFVSERVGNYQFSQQWSSLLDLMWVR